MFKCDLRWGDGDSRGSITDKSQNPDLCAALVAYRALLSRRDLEGQSVTARFVLVNDQGQGKGLYFSDFTKPVGQGRIHPLAPLDPAATEDEARALAAWLPSEEDEAAGVFGELYAAMEGLGPSLSMARSELAVAMYASDPARGSLAQAAPSVRQLFLGIAGAALAGSSRAERAPRPADASKALARLAVAAQAACGEVAAAKALYLTGVDLD